ncbi:TetR/AcrR family transcriptional regulator [Actinomadura yumaensis]|uniref:TetR/AcrR family transcriptional regulator n=1 Tax=Actinomadura yumaensis TaxID=111807 RepID=UPI00360A2C6E
MRIADADGLEAASMRRIAAEIGTGAMSIYRYVPSRQDLVDLMHDRVLGELDLPDRPSGDWRADLTLVAERSLALSRRHPWLVRLMRARPAFGPNELRLLEFQLGALDVGIPIDEMMVLAGVLNGYVESVARSRVAFTEEARRTGLTMEEWMRRSIPYVKRLLADGDHPLFARVITHARQPHMDDEQQFRYGLDRVLDCIAAALPTDPRPRPTPAPAPAHSRAAAEPRTPSRAQTRTASRAAAETRARNWTCSRTRGRMGRGPPGPVRPRSQRCVPGRLIERAHAKRLRTAGARRAAGRLR